MDGVEFIIGPVSEGAAKVLAIGAAAYFVATTKHTVDAFAHRLPDRGSAILATIVMAALSVALWVDGARLVPAPFSLAVIGVYMAGIMITVGYTLSDAAKALEKLRGQIKTALDELRARTIPEDKREAWFEQRLRLELGHEEKRKTPHLMMGFFFVIYGILGYIVLKAILHAAPTDADFTRESWHNLRAAVDGGYLAAGHMTAVVCLLGLLFLLLPVEVIRLRRPELDYPFKNTIMTLLRERERGLFGAHYYITATLPLAVLWLTRDPATWDRTLYAVLALLGITIFADAASALVGVRWGKKKWPHNTNKSYLGTAGGTVAAFAVALPFTGLPVAVASAAVFLLVDILAPVPFSASDNILNPLALAATYTVLSPYLAPMLPFF